ncbi:P-loop NTPase family protein [Paenibacillus sp. BAC0078]
MDIRIRIIGSCGSGKSYIAKELSRRYEIPCYETDNFVWDRSIENCRNSVEVRDAQLAEAVASSEWIIEGAHYKWGSESFRQADVIFLIRPGRVVRDLRVVGRFVKTRLGLERGNYKQTFKNLYVMLFEWNRGFDREGVPEIMKLTEPFAEKLIIVNNNQEILQHVSRYADSGGAGSRVLR